MIASRIAVLHAIEARAARFSPSRLPILSGRLESEEEQRRQLPDADGKTHSKGRLECG